MTNKYLSNNWCLLECFHHITKKKFHRLLVGWNTTRSNPTYRMTSPVVGVFWDDCWKVMTTSGNWYYLNHPQTPDDPFLQKVIESYRSQTKGLLQVTKSSENRLKKYEIL